MIPPASRWPLKSAFTSCRSAKTFSDVKLACAPAVLEQCIGFDGDGMFEAGLGAAISASWRQCSLGSWPRFSPDRSDTKSKRWKNDVGATLVVASLPDAMNGATTRGAPTAGDVARHCNAGDMAALQYDRNRWR